MTLTQLLKPDAGELAVTLVVIDSFGRQITRRSTEVISRASGWNDYSRVRH